MLRGPAIATGCLAFLLPALIEINGMDEAPYPYMQVELG